MPCVIEVGEEEEGERKRVEIVVIVVVCYMQRETSSRVLGGGEKKVEKKIANEKKNQIGHKLKGEEGYLCSVPQLHTSAIFNRFPSLCDERREREMAWRETGEKKLLIIKRRKSEARRVGGNMK